MESGTVVGVRDVSRRPCAHPGCAAAVRPHPAGRHFHPDHEHRAASG